MRYKQEKGLTTASPGDYFTSLCGRLLAKKIKRDNPQDIRVFSVENRQVWVMFLDTGTMEARLASRQFVESFGMPETSKEHDRFDEELRAIELRPKTGQVWFFSEDPTASDPGPLPCLVMRLAPDGDKVEYSNSDSFSVIKLVNMTTLFLLKKRPENLISVVQAW